jgi:hypothetical protein
MELAGLKHEIPIRSVPSKGFLHPIAKVEHAKTIE